MDNPVDNLWKTLGSADDAEVIPIPSTGSSQVVHNFSTGCPQDEANDSTGMGSAIEEIGDAYGDDESFKREGSS